jgi:V8-like Glu-specific endopeptidase
MHSEFESGSSALASDERRLVKGKRQCGPLILAAMFLVLTARAQSPTSTANQPEDGGDKLSLAPHDLQQQAVAIAPKRSEDADPNLKLRIQTMEAAVGPTPRSPSFSEALQLWKQCKGDVAAQSHKVAKSIQEKMENYRKELRKVTEISKEDRMTRWDANDAAKKVVEAGMRTFLDGGSDYIEETDDLARLYRALDSEADSILHTGFPCDGKVDAKTRVDFAGFDVAPDDETIIADELPDSEGVLDADMPAEGVETPQPTPATVSNASPSKKERHRRSDAEEADALESYSVGVAIRKADTHEIVGSGTIIGKDVILTCAHVVGKGQHERYEVLSEQSGAPDRIYPLGERVTVGRYWSLTRNWLDYALFNVEAAGDNKEKISKYVRPRKVSLAPMQRGNSIYFSGYPQDEAKRCTATGRIVYPFQSEQNGADLAAFFGDYYNRGTEELYKHYYDEFSKCYKKDGFFYCLVRRVGMSEDQPVHGVEIEGSPGDSGSPVFSWEQRKLIGIMIGGRGNSPSRPAIWSDMHFVLPLGPVIKQLKGNQSLAKLKERYGIEVDAQPRKPIPISSSLAKLTLTQ